MKVQEAKGVCKNRSKWMEVICLPQWESGVMLCIYVCMKCLIKMKKIIPNDRILYSINNHHNANILNISK
jgi:hypothetical protein